MTTGMPNITMAKINNKSNDPVASMRVNFAVGEFH
jgi:hypothetical protein